MPFAEILLKSIKYPWKYRALWILGLLFGLFSSTGNISNNFEPKDIENITKNIDPAVITGIGLVAVVLIVASILLSIWFQIGMTQGALVADLNKSVKLKDILKTKKGTFWNMVVLQILLPLGLVLAFVVVLIPFVLLFIAIPKPYGLIAGVITGVLAVLALIPALVYLGLIWELASRYTIVDSKRAINSLKESRKLLKGSGWLTLGFTIIVGMIAGSASFFAIVPFIIVVLITIFFVSEGISVAVIISGTMAFLSLILFLTVSGYFQASSQVGHTLWWKELKKLKK